MPRVTFGFRRLYLTRRLPGRLWGLINAGNLYFEASIDGETVGSSSQRIRATWLMEFPNPRQWQRTWDTRDQRRISIRLRVMEDRTLAVDPEHANIEVTTPWPFQPGTFMHVAGPFVLEWFIRDPSATSAAAAGEIRACRGRPGSNEYSTVSGRTSRMRLEFHPVRPCPTGGSGPNRPAAMTGAAWENEDNSSVLQNDPVNCVPNPPVIPVLSTRVPAEIRQQAARIECTWYWPQGLGLSDGDMRVEWSHEVVTGSPQIQFYPHPGGRAGRGLKVLVYGRPGANAEGEVRLTVRLRDALVGEYRALVRQVKELPFRVNILNGGSRAYPRVTPDLAVQHIAVANRFFRQLGVQLVPDTSLNIGHLPAAIARECQVTRTDHVGYYRVNVPRDVTRGISGRHTDAALINYRAGILNINYVHSIHGGYLGYAMDFRGSGASVSDNGRPSSSWKRPSGVAPDGTVGNITITTFGSEQRAGHANLYACLIANANGSPSTDQITYGGSIAHELGHVLGLRHRVGDGDDTMRYPPLQNVMHGNAGSHLAQDFDILQRRALEQSPFVQALP